MKSTENEGNEHCTEDDSTVLQVPNVAYNTFPSGAATAEDGSQQPLYYEVVDNTNNTLPISKVKIPSADDHEYEELPISSHFEAY